EMLDQGAAMEKELMGFRDARGKVDVLHEGIPLEMRKKLLLKEPGSVEDATRVQPIRGHEFLREGLVARVAINDGAEEFPAVICMSVAGLQPVIEAKQSARRRVALTDNAGGDAADALRPVSLEGDADFFAEIGREDHVVVKE